MKLWYGGVEWTPNDISPIVDALKADPDELPAFIDASMRSIRSLFSWHQYETAREWFDVLTRIHEAVSKVAP
jgi:hypothetical protein